MGTSQCFWFETSFVVLNLPVTGVIQTLILLQTEDVLEFKQRSTALLFVSTVTNVTLCRRFGGKYCLLLHGRKVNERSKKETPCLFDLIFSPGELLPDYTASHLRRHHSSESRVPQLNISHITDRQAFTRKDVPFLQGVIRWWQEIVVA
jgi:hypothetical protein